MSELPFYFHAPTPRYFRDNGLLKNQKNLAFITWCFERCSPEERIIFHDNQKITLKPYQFIFGRPTCSDATGLTDDEIRTQQKRWENLGFLKKAPNKTPNRFTIYEWVLTAFLKDDPQLKPRQTPDGSPTNPHNQDIKKTRSKEDHHPYPSSENDGLTDDFPSIEKKEEEIKIEVYSGIFLTQSELDQCIAIKGSLEAVKHAVEFIMRSPGRKRKIQDWPRAMTTWEIKTNIKPRLKENEDMAKRLENTFQDFKDGNGYRCYIYTDKKKDQRGILMESSSAYVEPFFVSFVDPEFKEKVSKFLRDKKMQKGRLANT